MKQVWQTDDGSIFEKEDDALEWEGQQVFLNSLEELVWTSTTGVHRGDVREVLEYLLAHYNVTPK